MATALLSREDELAAVGRVLGRCRGRHRRGARARGTRGHRQDCGPRGRAPRGRRAGRARPERAGLRARPRLRLRAGAPVLRPRRLRGSSSPAPPPTRRSCSTPLALHPRTRGSRSCTGSTGSWPTSRTPSRWSCWPTTCTGLTSRRCASSSTSGGGSTGCRWRSSPRPAPTSPALPRSCSTSCAPGPPRSSSGPVRSRARRRRRCSASCRRRRHAALDATGAIRCCCRLRA